jgi:hypothetical protein
VSGVLGIILLQKGREAKHAMSIHLRRAGYSLVRSTVVENGPKKTKNRNEKETGNKCFTDSLIFMQQRASRPR